RICKGDIEEQRKDERMEGIKRDEKSCAVSTSSEPPAWDTVLSAMKTESSESAETIKPAKAGVDSTNSSPLLGSETTEQLNFSTSPQYSSDEASPPLKAIPDQKVAKTPTYSLDTGAPVDSSTFQPHD